MPFLLLYLYELIHLTLLVIIAVIDVYLHYNLAALCTWYTTIYGNSHIVAGWESDTLFSKNHSMGIEQIRGRGGEGLSDVYYVGL